MADLEESLPSPRSSTNGSSDCQGVRMDYTAVMSSAGSVGSEGRFGVQSFGDRTKQTSASVPPEEETTASKQHENADVDKGHLRRRSTLRPNLSAHDITSHADLSRSTGDDDSCATLAGKTRLFASPSLAPSVTSTSLDSQDIPSSLSSSPKSRSSRSFRRSTEGFARSSSSQAVMSSEEDESNIPAEVEDSVPQLIMPSIKMPSRRPFTIRGKSMGRLKIVIAGKKGSGKTSLIKSIVQLCEDIVHVDTFPSSPLLLDQPRPKSKGKQSSNLFLPHNAQKFTVSSEARIFEIAASTKPYPQWWSELDEGKLLPRRKSMGDSVLERNLCFVDVTSEGDHETTVESVKRYMDIQLSKTLFSDTAEDDLVGLLGGTGGSQVDLVLYLVTPSGTEGDISAIKRLSELTNIIVVLAKSDLLSSSELLQAKEDLHQQLAAHDIEAVNFAVYPDGTSRSSTALPFAVCSALSPDIETMDASLLMSPDYVRPIQPSDLGCLLSLILDPVNMGKLRYTAASRLVRSRREAVVSQRRPCQPTAQDGTLTSDPPSYLQARIAAHTAREETFAQARLAKWAVDLHRGLAQERARYVALTDRDRARWLEEQVNNIRSTPSHSEPSSPLTQQVRHGYGSDIKRLPPWSRNPRAEAINVDDPLGLIRFIEKATRHGWLMLRWMGVGALAGAVVWAYRTWDGN